MKFQKNLEIIKTLFAIIILIGVLTFSYRHTKAASEFNPYSLNLNSNTGPITLNKIKENKITLIYFGFLSCPDACPTTLSLISSVFKELPPDKLSKISFLFVDLDPERDTLSKLQVYSRFFNPKIIPIVLPIAELELFTKYFGIAFMKVPLKSQLGYTIDHSTDIIVLNSNKIILEPIEHGTPKKLIILRLNNLINQYTK